ncbi:MAG: hypothetical protein M5U34_09570 [Chloroflexi bacterium]|nr:hypothetical protein [Chloroflexota bacterium]
MIRCATNCLAPPPGKGHLLNAHGEKRPLQVSAISHINEALLCHDWSHEATARQSTLETISQLAHHVFSIRSFGAAALALAWLAPAGPTFTFTTR